MCILSDLNNTKLLTSDRQGVHDLRRYWVVKPGLRGYRLNHRPSAKKHRLEFGAFFSGAEA